MSSNTITYTNAVFSSDHKVRKNTYIHKCTNIADMMASKRFKNRIAHIEVEMQIQNEQGPVSTMQKTGCTNFSSFLVWSEKEFHLWMWSLEGNQQLF